ncbi:hypothetical protein ABE137_12345 [Brevibacillus laterosporus]|uniref:hypothetical protein n=1 Tax=Brevibacillus phage Sundance TaxID=1691958 RepID=UPI0006BE0969|nr:hypothetical protein AVT09_gp144 [Brevibacillus phage Sundance]ALA47960.1 hypothetical protein SUNDANCE_144 [Brevibacillus phage Sundance]
MDIRCIKQVEVDGVVYFIENARYSAFEIDGTKLVVQDEQGVSRIIAERKNKDWENDECFHKYFRIV